MSVMHENKLIILLVCLTTISSIILSSSFVSADDSVVDEINITVPVSCTMSSTGMQSHNAEIANGAYTPDIGSTTLRAFCNDNNGFSIYAIGYTGNQYEGENHTKLVGQSTNGTIATKAYESGDTTSNWSMKLTKITDATVSYNPQNLTISTGYDNWHAVPDTFAKVAEYHANTGSSSTDTTLGVKLETTYAAYISSSQPADTYVGQVKYTLMYPYDTIKPAIPKSIAEATTMQEANTCPDSLVTNQIYTLKDSRDNTEYRVAKLVDGRCWMLDNLVLDITDPAVQTNLTNETTNASNLSLEYLKGVKSRDMTTDPSGNYATEAVGANWKRSYTEPAVYKLSQNDTYSSDSLSEEARTWRFGFYYNYCATFAGSYCFNDDDYGRAGKLSFGEPEEDICPLGWKVPTGSEDVESDYYKLYNLSSGYAAFRQSLKLPLSGMMLTSPGGVGIMGSWWASTFYDSSRSAHELCILNSGSQVVYGGCSSSRDAGKGIRCILRQ